MVRTWSVGAPIGGAVLAAALLAGCGSPDDDAAASPSSTTSAGTSASAEPSPGATPADYVPASLDGPAQNVPKPVLPELAKEESLAGAQAFLDYWSDAMWYAYQTGDTSYARNIISPNCAVCMDQLDLLEEIYETGSWAIGGRESIRIQGETITPASDGIYKPVVVGSTEGAKLVRDGTTALEVQPNAGGNEPFLVYLDYKDGRWIYISAANISRAGGNG